MQTTVTIANKNNLSTKMSKLVRLRSDVLKRLLSSMFWFYLLFVSLFAVHSLVHDDKKSFLVSPFACWQFFFYPDRTRKRSNISNVGTASNEAFGYFWDRWCCVYGLSWALIDRTFVYTPGKQARSSPFCDLRGLFGCRTGSGSAGPHRVPRPD